MSYGFLAWKPATGDRLIYDPSRDFLSYDSCGNGHPRSASRQRDLVVWNLRSADFCRDLSAWQGAVAARGTPVCFSALRTWRAEV